MLLIYPVVLKIECFLKIIIMFAKIRQPQQKKKFCSDDMGTIYINMGTIYINNIPIILVTFSRLITELEK